MNTRSLLAVCVALSLASTAEAQMRIPIRLPGQQAPNATPFDLAIARGDRALQQGNLDEAQRQFEQASRLNAQDARPSFYLGEIARRREQWPAAEAHFRAAIQRNARMAEAHASLGAVLRELDRGADAQRSFEAALRIDPQLGEAHYGLALCLEDAGQRERAVSEYRTAVRLSPRDPLPALNLGILLASDRPARGTQPRAEALSMLQTALRNGSDDVAVLISAGPALRLLGEHASAADALERARARSRTPSASLLGELAQALWAAGQRPMALQRIGEAVQQAPSAAELHYVRALMQAESGDRAGAQGSLRAVLQHGANTPLAARARQRLAALGGR
ncbi:MAG: tetratricopeptide repeat protein [Polyangiales bacterium]